VTALRLVWRDVHGDGQVWVADLGRFRCEVWWSGRGWPWGFGVASPSTDDVHCTIRRQNRICAETEDRVMSCAAAESAALSLLVDALAAYGTRPPDGYEVTPWPEQDGVCEAGHVALKRHGHSIGNPYPDDAIVLGVAIVAAGVAARKAGG
jgi:hypothetical protein